MQLYGRKARAQSDVEILAKIYDTLIFELSDWTFKILNLKNLYWIGPSGGRYHSSPMKVAPSVSRGLT